MNKDLRISAKFAHHLARLGMLMPLVNALRAFRDRENYPFYLEQKRIIKQAVLKAIGNEKLTLQKISSEKFQKKLDEVADQIYGTKEKTREQWKTLEEIKEMVIKQKAKK